MNDLWCYGEGEWIADFANTVGELDAVGKLDAVYAHISWRKHVVAPRTIYQTSSRTETYSRESGIATAKATPERTEIVAAGTVVFQSRWIIVLMELKLQLNGAVRYTLLTGKRKLAINLIARCKQTYKITIPGEKQRKQRDASSYFMRVQPYNALITSRKGS